MITAHHSVRPFEFGVQNFRMRSRLHCNLFADSNNANPPAAPVNFPTTTRATATIAVFLTEPHERVFREHPLLASIHALDLEDMPQLLEVRTFWIIGQRHAPTHVTAHRLAGTTGTTL